MTRLHGNIEGSDSRLSSSRRHRALVPSYTNETAYLAGQQRQQEQQAEVPEHLRQQLRLKKPPKGDGSIGVEKLLLSLFETSIKSFNHSDALKNKLRDKTVSLHPSGMSLSSVRKKHTPWRQGEECVLHLGNCVKPSCFLVSSTCFCTILVLHICRYLQIWKIQQIQH